MPTADATLTAAQAPTRATIAVRFSIAMELMWATYLAHVEPEPEYPARVGRFGTGDDLPTRIAAMWGDGEACFTEILVAADRGGVLFEDDLDRFWAGLEAGVAGSRRVERLASETPADRERFLDRLARLRRDRALRDRWLRLLKDAWGALAERWEREGRAAVEAMVWELQARLPDHGTYADLAPVIGTCDFNGLVPRLVGEAIGAGYEVTVVPTWLGRKGFLLSLPDRMLWGPPTPTRAPGPSAETRERARRFKALGDPTRLAIFESVARRPHTVGELSVALGVAQPTVSNHVRILRDAGLLRQEDGGGRRLAPDIAGFERFLAEARRAVTPPPPHGAAGVTGVDSTSSNL
jgi:DNA-binding transcriptional ArsR family regulator